MNRKNQAVELDLFAASDEMEAQPNEIKAQPNEIKAQSKETKASSSDAMGKDEEAKSVISSDVASLFLRLSQSKFRSSFYLNQKDRDIIAAKGLATIREHARQIIAKRLAPAVIPNDGRQTPMRHGTSPVFIAQHATGCCCRGCLEKWHHIPKGRALTEDEQSYVVEVLMHWIEKHCLS